ncbi:MAG: hydroxymethylbilane synthase [Anaerotignaceae bacterium]
MSVIRVGSRDSKLAVIQAEIVMEAIKAFDKSIELELVTMKTTGDKILNKTLDKIGGKGLFVKELDEALLNKEVDITVHSYKDMPMDINENLPVVAVSKREIPTDVFIYNTEILKDNPLIGCSSKRRTVQLNQMGFLNVKPLRGNVQTRLKKLENGEYDAIVLAAAGIHRLGLENVIKKYFTVAEILPSACQGIIAVQGRKGEDFSFLQGFNDKNAEVVSKAERAFVRALDGGCSSPMAAYATLEGEEITLSGMYVDENNNIFKDEITGNAKDCEQLGFALAKTLGSCLNPHKPFEKA